MSTAAESDVVVVLSTLPVDDRGTNFAHALVDERLAACVNLVPGLRSIYRWKGEVTEDAEVLAVIKTTRARLPALLARLPELHPYQVPEAVVLPAIGGHLPYLSWVAAETSEAASADDEDT